jgi:hypothetical protein
MNKPKYNITISEGCTAFFTEINNKIVGGEYEPSRFPDEEIDELVDYLCEEFKKSLKESTVNLNDLIRCFQPDSWESSSEPCDQCGDSVYTQTWIFE